jgi:predicted deacylase
VSRGNREFGEFERRIIKLMKKYKLELEWITDDNKIISFPLGIIEGAKNGPSIVITAGVHGAECCGIAAAIELFNYLNPEMLSGKVVICTCFNKEALESHHAFTVPTDKKPPLVGELFNLPKRATYSEYMTHYFQTEVLNEADYFIELHGGDVPEEIIDFVMYPITGNKRVDSESKKLAISYNIPLVLSTIVNTRKAQSDRNAEPCFMILASRGIPSILCESGSFGVYNIAYAKRHFHGLINMLSVLGVINEGIAYLKEQQYAKYMGNIQNHIDGLWFPVKSVGDSVHKDETVGKITDYFGVSKQEIIAPFDAKIVALRRSLYVRKDQALFHLASRSKQYQADTVTESISQSTSTVM